MLVQAVVKNAVTMVFEFPPVSEPELVLLFFSTSRIAAS